MPKILKITRFGNPILRTIAKPLAEADITSHHTRELIENMRHSLQKMEYGVGLAAPQVGVGIALSVISIKPTPTRPELTPFETVIINPKITATYGRKNAMWEGCMSCGSGDNLLFAQVPRYKKVKLRWYDENAKQHEEILTGFVAHVAQHETDHLNGILFVDKVKDPSTYMMADEYRKRILKP